MDLAKPIFSNEHWESIIDNQGYGHLATHNWMVLDEQPEQEYQDNDILPRLYLELISRVLNVVISSEKVNHRVFVINPDSRINTPHGKSASQMYLIQRSDDYVYIQVKNLSRDSNEFKRFYFTLVRILRDVKNLHNKFKVHVKVINYTHHTFHLD